MTSVSTILLITLFLRFSNMSEYPLIYCNRIIVNGLCNVNFQLRNGWGILFKYSHKKSTGVRSGKLGGKNISLNFEIKLPGNYSCTVFTDGATECLVAVSYRN